MTEDGGTDITLTRDGGVARVVLNRPEVRNAMSLAMWRRLGDISAELSGDDGLRAVVITGAGSQAFSAGADIAEFAETYATPDIAAATNATIRASLAALAAIPAPVIAEVRGACFGGGVAIAMHADLRFAAQTARFAITPAKLGLAYSFGDTARLVSLVGPARAKDILFSGRTLSADDAVAIGLVDRSVPDADLETRVQEYLDVLSSVSGTSVRTAKAMIDAIAGGASEETAELRQLFASTFESDDFAEGYRAFLDKRRPEFG